MIKDEETYSKFGYYPHDISDMSNKDLVCICDYCHLLYTTTKKRINIGRKVVAKDACVKCKFKKREDVSMARDGVKNSAQRPEVRKKISEKSVGFGEKFRDSMMKKYGAQHSMQIESIREKSKATLMERYGVDNPTKNEEIKKRAIENAIKTKIKNNTINYFDGRTYPQIAEDIGISRNTFLTLVKKYGIEYAVSYSKKQNGLELIMKQWLEKEKISFVYQRYFPEGNYYADFFLPDYNLVIELDGIYWHSELFKYKTYHLDKKNFYTNIGLNSLFFRENEICNSFKAVQSMIDQKLKRCDDIDINQTVCCIKTKKEADEFCIHNHINLSGSGDIALFLYFNDEPVMLIQLDSKEDNHYEISRICYKLNTYVMGGFEKLFSFFVSKYNPKYILKYVNLRYEDDTELKNLSFKQDGDCFINFEWVAKNNNWSTEYKVYSNLEFKGNTGYDHGLVKIFDCGQKKFVWEST
jgi:very-short-patch-repair endonuclease